VFLITFICEHGCTYILDTISLCDFLLKHRIPGVEVNSKERSITGTLTNKQIKIACKEYDARLNIVVPAK
jgi:hypothetical protein